MPTNFKNSKQLPILMSMSIDELCTALDIKAVSAEEFRSIYKNIKRDDFYNYTFSSPERAAIMDGYAIPGHRSIATLVSTKFDGAENVLELGYGTGFRLLYYAINHPEIKFYGIDIEPEARIVVERRKEKLGINNVELYVGDFMEENHLKASVVLAVDCFTEEIGSIAKFIKRSSCYVDKCSYPSSLFLVYYQNPGDKNLRKKFSAQMHANSLNKIEAFKADYKMPNGKVMRATLLVASSIFQ